MTISEDASVKVENRKYPRVYFNLNVKYALIQKGGLPNPKQCRIEDLGAGGMAMQSKDEIEPGQMITLNLYIPPLEKLNNITRTNKSTNEYSIPVTFLAKVIWCCSNGDNGFRIGIKFVDVNRNDVKRFKHFLVEFELDEPLV